MLSQLRAAVVSFILLTLLTGVLYPLLVSGAARAFFSRKAGGSLFENNGRVVGSELIGQSFSDPKYFWSRPSANSPLPYAGDGGTGSNLGPTNPALLEAIKQRIAALRAVDPGNDQPVPVDLVTASASGLDPEISPAAALYQAARISRLRQKPVEEVKSLVQRNTSGRSLGVLGEPGVNVLKLNLALDGM